MCQDEAARGLVGEQLLLAGRCLAALGVNSGLKCVRLIKAGRFSHLKHFIYNVTKLDDEVNRWWMLDFSKNNLVRIKLNS